MRSRTRYGIWLAAALIGAAAAGASAGAQRAAKPIKRSFSNRPTQSAAKPAPSARKATQEELTDAVLGDAMNKIWTQTDEHGHLGEYNHVINLCKVIVQGDPHNMEAYGTPAYLLWSTSRTDDALAVLKEGIAANPRNYFMYDEMGRFWNLQLNKPKEAIPYFEKAVTFECPALTWHSLANCYEKVGQLEKAVGAWGKASLYPNADPVALVRLKRARARLAEMKRGH